MCFADRVNVYPSNYSSQLVMACCFRYGSREDGDSENYEHGKPQLIPTNTSKWSSLKPRPKFSQPSFQNSRPTKTQPHLQNAQPPSSSILVDATNNKPAHASSAPSGTVKIGKPFTSLQALVKFRKYALSHLQKTAYQPENQVSSVGAQVSESKPSNEEVVSGTKTLASVSSTEKPLDPQQSLLSFLVPVFVPHATGHIETTPTQTVAQAIVASKGDMDHSSGSRYETATSGHWKDISNDNLRLMEENQFQFNLLPIPDVSAAKVDTPDGFPNKVTTKSATSYLISTIRLYDVKYHLPKRDHEKKVIYYELEDIPVDWGTHGNIWFGFSRLDADGPPGTGLGSFGINRCEGNLYYNGECIGKRRNLELDSGVKIGIGMVFSYVDRQSDPDSESAVEVRVFHTRNGLLLDNVLVDKLLVGDENGFNGYHDLFATIGTVDRVVFEVSFQENLWTFKPKEHGI